MGDEAKQKLGVRGLQNAAGFLQQKIARRIDTRYTPRLRFVLDQGVKKSIEVARILDDVLSPTPGPADTFPADDPDREQQGDAALADPDRQDDSTAEENSRDEDPPHPPPE
jgi:ribosome-binding factor A